jgi:hypothetical protein
MSFFENMTENLVVSSIKNSNFHENNHYRVHILHAAVDDKENAEVV